jgi:hypothetical protein
MTTVAEFARTTRRQLYGTELAKINVLNGAIVTASTAVIVSTAPTSYPGGFGAGARLEIEDELVYVRSISGSTATVIRAVDNTTAASHADAVQVHANPRWPLVDIYDAMKDEIRSWMPHLFAADQIEFTMSAGAERRGWDWTPTTDLFLLGATVYPTTTSGTDFRGRELRAIEIRRGQDTAVFASGSAFIVTDPIYDEAGTISVSYAKQFALGTFTGSTDLETTVGIPASTLDVLRAGVKWRMLADQEASRSNVQGQGESRTGREVEVGAAVGQAEAWRRVRDRRLAEEITSLRTKFPYRVGY